MRSVAPPQRVWKRRPRTAAFIASVGSAVRPESRPGPYTDSGRKPIDGILCSSDARGLLVGDLVDSVVRGRVRRRGVLDRPRRIEARPTEDRRRRGVHHPLDLAAGGARGLEDVRGADDVDRGASRRVLTAEWDLPGREVDHAPDRVVADDAPQALAVGDVTVHDDDAARRVGP